MKSSEKEVKGKWLWPMAHQKEIPDNFNKRPFHFTFTSLKNL